MWKSTPDGVILPVKLTPKSSRDEIIGWENGELRVRISAVPEKGQANAHLIKFLSKVFKVPKSRISILQGETSRHKVLLLTGVKTLPQISQYQ
jgi:uncharacterized protein